MRNVTLGFQHSNDTSLLEPFVSQYFSMLNDIWNERSYKIAEYIVVGLYPASLASTSLRDATQAWLDANPEVPALRRLVTENLAGVIRALKVQGFDAQSFDAA